ncbi:putative quinol monooxygenase [Chelativorans salis]|uniref:Antibiotic biosynthesis monooxygenase n=1 Tax=Chelativorans salis TaxID=2978478 RepID=A0ABT2LQG9_9HYPH|nr:putative quinol monooxygenase [Chelativorans sp. EGI FJ00035]MCT7376796.1 antibiotic biosynthesis monooxygenase [Chelativorans sp. EGI FJ00035]
MAHYFNLTFVRARSGRSDDLGEALLALVAPSRGEAACISHHVHRSKHDPDLWMVYEIWLPADGLDRHFFLPHMNAFAVRSPELVEGDFDFHGFTRLSDRA